MIELRVLGTLDLRDPDNGDLGSILTRPKLLALLIYLVLARPNGFRHRDTLLGLFWPELGQSRARRSLNQALYELRKALGEGVLVSRGDEEVGLDRSRFWCDAEAFEGALTAGNRHEGLDLYTGDLLCGFALSGCEEFEAWLDERREGLRLRALEAMRAEADALSSSGESGEAAYWLRRGLRWEPYDEDLARRLLEALLALGDRTGALREYQTFARRLVEELGVEPSPEVAALEIRARTTENGVEPGRAIQGTGDESDPVPAVRAEVATATRSGHGHRPALVMGVLAMVAMVAVLSLIRREEIPAAPEARRVLVAGFENRTGDPELDDVGFMAAEWIAQELSRTGLVRPTLPPGGHRGVAWDEESNPMDVALRLGAGLALSGSYRLVRDSLVFSATILAVPGGEVVRAIDPVASPRDDPAAAVELLRSRTTGVLAALVDDRLKSWATSPSSQPPSYEAYRVFAEGMELRARREYRAAADAFHRAAAYDSLFTAPLLYAMFSHQSAIYYPDESRRDQRQAELADSVGRYLEARRDRLPPWEAAWVDMAIAEREVDTPAWYAAMRRITDMTPEPRWLLTLSARTRQMNRPREALEILEGLDPQQPDIPEWNSMYLRSLMHLHHILGDYEREAAALREFRANNPPARPAPPRTVGHELYDIRSLAALGRTAELDRAMRQLQSTVTDPFEIMMPSMEVLIHGHPEVARAAWEWYLDQEIEVADDPEELWRWGPGSALLFLGRGEEARPHYERMLGLAAPGSDNVIMFMGALGQIAADRGDRTAALEYDRRLATLDLEPFHEPMLKFAVQRQRISIAIALGEHRRAISMLEDAIEGGMPLYGNGDPEMFHLRWLELRGNPAYEALVRR